MVRRGLASFGVVLELLQLGLLLILRLVTVETCVRAELLLLLHLFELFKVIHN